MDETTRASCGAHLRINEDRTVTPIPSPSSAAPTLTRERDRWTGRFDTKEIEYGFKGHLEKEGDVPRMPEHRLGLLLNNPDAAWPTLETKDLALDLRDARRVLRQLAATADTISPQEVINVVADALGMDRHQYAGECDPNRSLMDWEIRARAASPERVREQAIAEAAIELADAVLIEQDDCNCSPDGPCNVHGRVGDAIRAYRVVRAPRALAAADGAGET